MTCDFKADNKQANFQIQDTFQFWAPDHLQTGDNNGWCLSPTAIEKGVVKTTVSHAETKLNLRLLAQKTNTKSPTNQEKYPS